MNLLELCQSAAREVGIAGVGPLTAVGQTGEYGDVVRWVVDSYIEIQNRNSGHWRWLKREFTFQTVADQSAYAWPAINDVREAAVIDRFNQWYVSDFRNPPKIYLTSAGIGTERWLSKTAWESFRSVYRAGTQNSQAPAHISINDQDELVLGPSPGDIYTVSGEYYRGPQVLALDADIPEMPTQFHKLIVWYAIENYGYKEAAGEVLARAQMKVKSQMRQLESNQLARMRKAGPLA